MRNITQITPLKPTHMPTSLWYVKNTEQKLIIGGTHALVTADLIKEAVADSNIMITGVFEYGGEASREHIDELNSHQEVIDADMIFACGEKD